MAPTTNDTRRRALDAGGWGGVGAAAALATGRTRSAPGLSPESRGKPEDMGISERPEGDLPERDAGSTDDEPHREMPPEPVPSPGERDRARLGDEDVSEQAP